MLKVDEPCSMWDIVYFYILFNTFFKILYAQGWDLVMLLSKYDINVSQLILWFLQTSHFDITHLCE
jgi:hypothetical protein